MNNQGSNTATRLKYLDIVKGICILMVINRHLRNNSSLFVDGVSFYLTAFFMISGILLYLKDENNLSYMQILIKKLRDIGYPYIALSSFYILVFIVYELITGQGFLGLFRNIYLTGSFLGIGTLWFLPTLFFAEIFFLYISKRIGTKSAVIFVSITAIISVFVSSYLTTIGVVGQMDASLMGILTTNILIVVLRSLIASGFIALGFYLGRLIKLGVLLKRNKYFALIVGVILFVLIYSKPLYIVGNDLHYAKIDTPIVYLFGGVVGALAVLFFSFGIEKIKFVSKALSWLGTNSMLIMTTHLEYKVVNLAYFLISDVIGINHWDFPILFWFMTFMIVIPIEIGIVFLIKNSSLINLYRFPKSKRN